MATKTIWQCTNCQSTFPKWLGKCSQCGEWGTVQEVTAAVQTIAASIVSSARAAKAATGAKPKAIKDIEAQKVDERLKTNINEFDRVIGGGIVPGSVTLLAAAPGAGKSSLLAAVAQAVAIQNKTVLYVSGEENETQVAGRHKRIGAISDNILILSESNLANVLESVEEVNPGLLIVDSVQTMVSASSEGKIGSPSQVVEVATDITTLAKRINMPVILVGHVTKNTSVAAGPQTLAHLVDAVLYLDVSDDSPLRLLRAEKSRFGGTEEIGLFQHTETGLEEVSDPSDFFTNPHEADASGYAKSITVEGLRAIPLEVQSLVTGSPLPNPRKLSHGVEHSRSLMIQAILEKYAGVKIGDKDVYVSSVAGMIVKDAATDLAIAAALLSSYLDQPLPEGSLFLGELSLTGEVRKARMAGKRIAEAKRLGFDNIYDEVRIPNIRSLLEEVRKYARK